MQFLHSLKYVHRDIKPANICIGAGPMNTRIYLIDYGDTVKQGKKISYTLPYWSIDAHKRLPARHRVDVESWFYVLIDLLQKFDIFAKKLHLMSSLKGGISSRCVRLTPSFAKKIAFRLSPGSLPWAKMYKEKDIESEKMQFWTGLFLTCT
ncbi:unnamed protein product [Heligmosomoides polygyrus]|uniref:non-specific serine/threonine protein kinase n=1 Tax=Heligmosomoides polygyrus TaxID=6339 RepID=A0A3P7X4H4_HELPZ|nr:unnamed protein product [Heligmosomoides polygyrus]